MSVNAQPLSREEYIQGAVDRILSGELWFTSTPSTAEEVAAKVAALGNKVLSFPCGNDHVVTLQHPLIK